ELAFVTSKRVRLHVAPEVRILEALEKHYGLEVEVRFTRIWDRLNRALYLWQEDGKSQVSAAQVSPLREPAAADSGSWQPLPPPLLSEPSPGGDAAAREAAAAMGPAATAPPMAPPEPPPAPVEAPPEPVPAATEKSGPVTRPVEVPEPPRTLAELDARLDEAEEREEIALTALEFFHQHFERVLLFMVRGAEAAAWMGSGEGVDQQLLASFRLGFDEPSLFLNLREGSPFFRGPLPRMEAHQRLARLWGGKMPRESVLLPVRVKQRLVAVVYGDRGGRDLAGLDLELMQQAAARVGAALQEFIARRKRGG
ncbi:MAG TPA: GAF domain-containing protein, partial [Thermoanaerobaculia bacterium]|nr:GAF domain-containing protein [Thermoanaerobaculia bacterium]